jgi:Uma2 family endonuclease
MITPVLKPISQMTLSPGSVMTISGVNWLEFEKILEELGEKRATKITYSQETLMIMVPLPEQEKCTELISDMVKIILRKTGQRYESFGSTTFKRDQKAGVEPDACFYIQNYQRMIDRRRLQIDDPPPDLAIEVDLTSATTLEAYRLIAVPELWIYTQGQLKIYLLVNDAYVAVSQSSIFPNYPLQKLIQSTIDRAWIVGSYQALIEFEASIN